MLPTAPDYLLERKLAPPAPAVGCATCWAAKYCASFSLDGPQPPPTCPLLPRPTARPRRRATYPRPRPKSS